MFNLDEDLKSLLRPKQDPERPAKKKLFLVGAILTPITLIGALWGYVRAYNRKLIHQDLPPTLAPIHPFALRAMRLFAALVWAALVLFILFIYSLLSSIASSMGEPGFLQRFLFLATLYLIVTVPLTILVLKRFEVWRGKMFAIRTKVNMFGSARLAENKDLLDLEGGNGIYIGGGYTYSEQGHLITIAGTRSGKFVNLIAPNLLGASAYDGSWFVIDPKGEAAFVTADYQRSLGRNVYIIDPWRVCTDKPDSFNPLDITLDDPETLIDDASMMAQMIVPHNPRAHDPYWDDKARSLIAALIIYCALLQIEIKKQKIADDKAQGFSFGDAEVDNVRTLSSVWRWLRYDEDKFSELLYDMAKSPIENVSLCASEMMTLKGNEKAFASVIGTAQSQTDFIKSISLQASISRSTLDMTKLSEGNTVVYVVIPPDKLESQHKWLRLMTSTALKAVVRNRNKRVTFLLDEFSSLGSMPDIPMYMGLGAGFNITIWPIFQSLIQLQRNYGDSWESFLSGAAVKHFFGVGDNFSSEYISKMAGESSYIVYDRNIIGPDKGESRARPLVTTDEVRRTSANKLFTFIEQRPVALLEKFPYYKMAVIKDRAAENPYYRAKTGLKSWTRHLVIVLKGSFTVHVRGTQILMAVIEVIH